MSVTYMNKGCGDDDACSELFDDGRDYAIDRGVWKLHQEYRGKDTNSTSHQNDEDGANAQRYVVVSILNAA